MPAEIRVGIVGPAAETREMLRVHVQGLGLASVDVEADQYCVGFADRVTRRLIDARPDVVLVDMQEPDAALHTLRILHTSLPGSWLFVTSSVNDPLLIIDAMRAGAREYLLRPISPRSLSQAFSRFLSARERHQRLQGVGRLYSVTAAKGGAGATTIAVNLAACLATSGEARPALVDLQAPMGDAAGYLNLSPQYTLSDALAAAGRLDGVLLKSFMAVKDGLAVLPGPREPWSETGASPGSLGRVVEVLLEETSHVFADVPSSADGELLRTVFEASSAVLVVLTPELPSLWRAQRLLSVVDAFGCTDKLRLVVNRARRGEEVSDGEIEKTLGHALFWKLPNSYATAIRGINSGVPVARNGASELAASYQALASRLTGLSLGERRRGLLGGLLPFSTRPSNA